MMWLIFFVFFCKTHVMHCMEEYSPDFRGSYVWGYFKPPFVQKIPSPSPQSPLEAMVDLTNDLGVAILQDHSFSRGNFAFSPYGVASVLVVLYEGAQGESARQIHRAVHFPLDKSIMRVGFRDMHRHLKSYFSHEGYLSGVTLNKHNSSLNPEYKRILKFYGYNVDTNQSINNENDLNEKNSTTTTTTLSQGTITPVSSTEGVAETVATPTETPSEEIETEKTKNQTAADVTEKMNTTTTEVVMDKEDTTEMESLGKETTTLVGEEQESKDNATTLPSLMEPTTTSVEETTKKSNSDLDNGMLIPQPDNMEATNPPLEEEETKLNHSTAPILNSTTSETTTQPETETTTRETSNSTETTTEDLPTTTEENISNEELLTSAKNKTRGKRTIADYLKSPNGAESTFQLRNGMYGTHVSRVSDTYRDLPRLPFLVNGIEEVRVPAMTYTNSFPYAYISELRTKALEFPLDDIRYKLLILLPIERRSLRQLIFDLEDYPMRLILNSLQKTRARVTIPTFMVEGFVILTPTLQKLGIRDVFDSQRSNLSGMSTDPDLYVRNVEQSVTVVIRNYVEILDIQTRTMAARNIDHEFDATHPFLYFVLDSATNVALMAGQMLDPSNSRIYR